MWADRENRRWKQQQGMTIGPRASNQISANGAASATTIFNHYCLAQHPAPFLHQGPRHVIGAAAGRVWYN